MRTILVCIFISLQSTFAMNVDVELSIENNQLRVEYIFPEVVQGIPFTYPIELGRESYFKNMPELKENIVQINSDRLVLNSYDLNLISMKNDSGPIFATNSQNVLFLTDLLEAYMVYQADGTQGYIEKLNYYFEGELLHSRDVYDSSTWERYLILDKARDSIDLGVGELYIDQDMPNREIYISEIHESLQYIQNKLGKPISKPKLFFSYASDRMDEPHYDGRVIIASPIIQMSISAGLDLQSPRGLLVIYHALFSHEIVHHWNARNLDGESSSWIHEGGAEYLASMISQDVFSDQLNELVRYMESSNIQSCENPDEYTDFAYHCGHAIFKLVMDNSLSDPYEIFNELHALPLQTNQAVLDVFAKHTSPEAMNKVLKILEKEPK